MLGNEIKEARKKLGLTQKQLAEKADISRNALINYEANKRQPPLDIALRLSSALNLSSINTLLDFYIMSDDELTQDELEAVYSSEMKKLKNKEQKEKNYLNSDDINLSYLTEYLHKNKIFYALNTTDKQEDTKVILRLDDKEIILNIEDISKFNNEVNSYAAYLFDKFIKEKMQQ